jgi:hypothetical protein
LIRFGEILKIAPPFFRFCESGYFSIGLYERDCIYNQNVLNFYELEVVDPKNVMLRSRELRTNSLSYLYRSNRVAYRYAGIAFFILSTSGCFSTIKLASYPSNAPLTKAGKEVQFADRKDVAHCRLLGETEGKAKDDTIERAVPKAMNEVRNSAARMGATTVVYKETNYVEDWVSDGINITADAYRCPKSPADAGKVTQVRSQSSAEAQAQALAQAQAAQNAALAAQQAATASAASASAASDSVVTNAAMGH